MDIALPDYILLAFAENIIQPALFLFLAILITLGILPAVINWLVDNLPKAF